MLYFLVPFANFSQASSKRTGSFGRNSCWRPLPPRRIFDGTDDAAFRGRRSNRFFALEPATTDAPRYSRSDACDTLLVFRGTFSSHPRPEAPQLQSNITLLQDHESTHHRAPVAGLVDRTFWFDHKVAEDSVASDSTAVSFSNTYEVEMVAGLVEYLVSSNEYDYKDVTVLTPYNGQLAALKARFRDTCSLWLSELDREALLLEGFLDEEEILVREETSIEFGNMLKLATIDNFQGEGKIYQPLYLLSANVLFQNPRWSSSLQYGVIGKRVWVS